MEWYYKDREENYAKYWKSDKMRNSIIFVCFWSEMIFDKLHLDRSVSGSQYQCYKENRHCECTVCRDDTMRILVNAAEECKRKKERIESSG